MEFPEMGCLDGSWTNEKHISFLNWMEASFVRKMLKIDDCMDGGGPRLDRYLPDRAESTLDFDCGRNGKKGGQERRRRRRRRRGVVRETSSLPDSGTQDQVVPQLENMRCKRPGREEREELQIAVSTRH